MATASIAQVHTALLTSGREVIVKVRRPGIEEQIELDLALLRSTAELFERHSERAQLLQSRALADELESHLRAELDFVEEANNTEIIGRVLSQYEDLVVPEVIRPYVTERVLVLEQIHGQKVDADHGLPQERAEELARQFFRAYVYQVTVEGVYHADPHRGNVLLTTDGRLALVDFGLLGRLDDDTRRNLSLLLLAIAQNRADDVADLIIGLSRTSFGSDEPGFQQDIRRKLPRYHGRPLARIRAGEALADLQRISFEHGIGLPTTFALVGKTLAQADSIARSLYPELDPIALMEEDSLEVMLAETERRLEPNQLFSWLYTQLEPLGRMPRRVSQLANRLETGTFKVGIVPTDLEALERVMRSTANRVGSSVIVAALLVSSALLARVHDSALAGLRRILLRVRARALSPVEDHSHAGRALGAELCRVHALDHDMRESRVGAEPKERLHDLGAVFRANHALRRDRGPRSHRRVDEARAECGRADAVLLLGAAE